MLPFATRVGIFHKKVRRETGINQCTRRNFVFSVSLLLNREIETLRFLHNRTVDVSFDVATINVAMLAAGAQLLTAMPQIPHFRLRFYCIFGHFRPFSIDISLEAVAFPHRLTTAYSLSNRDKTGYANAKTVLSTTSGPYRILPE
jgi:hypothetical protein